MIVVVEQAFRLAASYIALGVETAAIISVTVGAAEAAISCGRRLVSRRQQTIDQRVIWVRFATWILLSLEFALGADIIRTAIEPTWDEIGKLAAIAGIRTVLNFFLARDVKEAAEIVNPGKALV